MIYLMPAETPQQVVNCLDQELFERISEDGHTRHGFTVPTEQGQLYLMIMDGQQTLGFWLLYPANGSTLNIHCNLLKGYRHHGKEAARLVLEWFLNDCPVEYQKLNAEIPVIYPEVYHFTKKQGFSDEGINRASILKQGKIIDQWRLGMTRAEVTEKLGGSNGIHS